MKTSHVSIQRMALMLSKRLMFFCLSMAFTAFVACSNESDEMSPNLSSDEKQTASFELQDDFYYDDADDIAMEAFVNEETNAGGKATTDIRLSGAVVVRVGTFTNGTLKIDFGAGCTDARGNVRKGSIMLEHAGRWNEEGAQWTITFDGYSINGVTITGTRKVTVTSVTEFIVTHDIELVDGKITWPDGSFASRACRYIRQREHNGSQLLNRLIIHGNAEGTLRNGRGFSIDILEALVYDRSCWESGVFIAVQGRKIVTHGDRELTIDYGDGTCDNMVTLTNKAGVSVQYEVFQ